MTTLRFKETDRGYSVLLKRVLELAKPRISVGVHAAEGGAAKTNGTTVLDVAMRAEFGLGQPMRSWLRAWYDEHYRVGYDEIRKVLQTVISGKRALTPSLEMLGQRFVGLIQQRISQRIPPPNAPATVKAKGSSTPLVDSGQFRSSITYRVKSGN